MALVRNDPGEAVTGQGTREAPFALKTIFLKQMDNLALACYLLARPELRSQNA